MSEVTAYTQELTLELFKEREQALLIRFSTLILQDKPNLTELWLYDRSLGGLGGYAMPSNPVENPFNTWGKDRNLFRSVQYAKSGLVYYPHSPRHIICDAGRSLEWTCKYILDYRKVIPRVNNHEMLGKNLARMRRRQIIGQDLYETCSLLGKMYNVAKHEISDTRPRTFATIDGIVAYFSLRKIHNRLLDLISHSSRQAEYPIYDESNKVRKEM